MSRVVVLAGGLDLHRGGQALRWRALAAATGGQIRPVGCDRWSTCAQTCAVTGSATAQAAWDWYYDRGFCPANADRLARELAAAGTTTVVCSGLETWRYVPALAATGGLHVVFDLHNVEYDVQEAIRRSAPRDNPYFAEIFTAGYVARTRDAEGAAIAAAHEVWVCSDDDARLVAATYRHTGPARVRVVPNVVAVADRPPVFAAPRRVSFTGRMDYYPNVAAANALIRAVAPLLTDRGVRLPVVIAGMWAQEVFDGVPLPPNVQLLSDPPDIDRLVAGSVMAVPLGIGGGSRFKILQAFAAGAPVVSTAKGAEGLAVVAGRHYLAAEDADGFAARIERLVVDGPLRVSLAEEAWQLTRERYSLQALTALLAEVRAG